tara:strand:+ start:1103 stop:1882 length:780 start_codon:yes stop_codon:yes gene_type:complete
MTTLQQLIAELERRLIDTTMDETLEFLHRILDPESSKYSSITLQRGSLSSIRSDIRQGLVSESNARITLNRIRGGTLYYIKMLDETDFIDLEHINFLSQPKQESPMSNDTHNQEEALLQIIKDNSRRRTTIVTSAMTLLAKYREWQDNRNVTPTYDLPSLRRLKTLDSKLYALVDELDESKMDALEGIMDKVTALMVGIPTQSTNDDYANLQKAYNLLQGRGFSDDLVWNQIQAAAPDDEILISICEIFEVELTTLPTQ